MQCHHFYIRKTKSERVVAVGQWQWWWFGGSDTRGSGGGGDIGGDCIHPCPLSHHCLQFGIDRNRMNDVMEDS